MKFLIIDDDASLRNLLKKRLLKRWPEAGIDDLDPVKSGVPGPDFPWAGYDIVFLDFDIGFNDVNGLDVLAGIKQHEQSPMVIMVTGQGSEDVAIKAIRRGATDYLIKYDVVTDKLFEMIEEALAESEITGDLKAISTAGRLDTTANRNEAADKHYLERWEIPGYGCHSEITRGQVSTLLAERMDDQQQVILKVLKFENTPATTLLIKRFTRELNILTDMDHPHIIQVLDHGVTGDCAYYAIPYLGGGDLTQRIRRGEITPEQAVDYIRQIADALQALHQRGIIHRDIKPSNILFKNEHTLVIADLGIVKDLASDEALTAHGEVLGTPYYMSIEQFNGSPVDKRSDIYSLGILFYELLAGVVPYGGESIMQVVYKHSYEKPPALPATVKKWQAVIEKMLAKDPEDRYQDMDEFLQAVQVTESA